jgi:ribose transport system permease protein
VSIITKERPLPVDPKQRRTPDRAPTLLHTVSRWQATPIVIVTIVLFIVAIFLVPKSLTGPSLVGMLVPAAILSVAAIGQTLVVQQKGIDLSTAGAISLAATLFAGVAYVAPLWVTLVVVAFAAAAGGLINGLLVTRLHITPIIATLASNSLLYGAVWTFSHGVIRPIPSALAHFATGKIGPIPTLVWIAVVLVVVVAIFMAKTATGRRFVAVGANPASAHAAGVNVGRYVIGAYVASGVFAGLAGVLLGGYVGASTLSLGDSYQLPVIAAVVVGGASLKGGRGSVVASAVAALFVGQIVQMVVTVGAPSSFQLLIQSIALAVAAAARMLPTLRRKPKKERVRHE